MDTSLDRACHLEIHSGIHCPQTLRQVASRRGSPIMALQAASRNFLPGTDTGTPTSRSLGQSPRYQAGLMKSLWPHPGFSLQGPPEDPHLFGDFRARNC